MSESHPLPPPGKLIDVGGYRLHYVLQGEEHPGPTVVGLAPFNVCSPDLLTVLPPIASYAPLLIYDRAGYGWSEPSPHEPTSDQIAQELYALLTNAAIPGPYVLVGASMGGVYARRFAQRYPDVVSGMVLIDSPHEAQWKQLPAKVHEVVSALDAEDLETLERMATLTHPEIVMLCKEKFPERYGDDSWYPPEIRRLVQDRLTPEWAATLLREMQAMDAMFETGQPPASHGDLPLIVLTATAIAPIPGLDEETMAIVRQRRFEAQAELAALSTQGTQIKVDCGHGIAVERPEVFLDTVRTMVDSLRQS